MVRRNKNMVKRNTNYYRQNQNRNRPKAIKVDQKAIKRLKFCLILMIIISILFTNKVFAKGVTTLTEPGNEFNEKTFKELNSYYNSFAKLEPLKRKMDIILVDKEMNQTKISDTFEYPIRIVNNRMSVSIYDLSAALNERVYWFKNDRIAVIGEVEKFIDKTNPNYERLIYVPINKDVIQKDMERHIIDAPATIDPVTNRTYLPLRALAEALDYKVLWDGETSTAYLVEK